MSKPLGIHLDEQVPPAIAAGLRRLGVDVTTTVDAGLISASDERQLAFAASQGRVLFTRDRDFVRLHRAGAEHCGIIYYASRKRTVGHLIEEIELIAKVATSEEMRNRVEYL